MKNSESIYIEDIGEVKIRSSKRARHINIRMKPFTGILVALPEGMNISKAEKFILEKKNWIISNRKKITAFEKTYKIFDEDSNFSICRHVLSVKRISKGKVNVKVKDRIIKAEIPKSKEIRSIEVQDKIREGITAVMRKEAKIYLPERVDYLSRKAGIEYNQLFIKNIKSRWGSCSNKNNINLSLHLMMLPEHLIDYVILHELAHIKYKNHSKQYWQYLNGLIKDAKVMDKELKNYRINHF